MFIGKMAFRGMYMEKRVTGTSKAQAVSIVLFLADRGIRAVRDRYVVGFVAS